VPAQLPLHQAPTPLKLWKQLSPLALRYQPVLLAALPFTPLSVERVHPQPALLLAQVQLLELAQALELKLEPELAPAQVLVVAAQLPPVHQAQVLAALHPTALQLQWPLSAVVLPAQSVSLPFSFSKQVAPLVRKALL
jgi:hypothetical protein